MKIEKIEIYNYRNLDGVIIHLNLESNYVVGENNIGKSNFLELISTISSGSGFSENDFSDSTKPITVHLLFQLNEAEYGSFGGGILPDDNSVIDLTITQDIQDVHPQIYHTHSSEPVQAKVLRKMNFLRYETNVNPDIESWFDHTKGDRVSFGKVADRAQFITLAAMNIFRRILELYKSKSLPFEESLIITKEGKKVLPLILAIDEPEVHLQPYMQRAVLNYYKRILKNDDRNFLELLKNSFGIDGIEGQLIIVTHSTDALIDDHRNIVRFYRMNDRKTSAICGIDLNIRKDVEKHLLMHFPDIKEAFYSKCVLIVEGETEYGCIRGFAKTLGISLDDYGICFVNAQGEGSIPKLQQLFSHFSIPTIVIYDSDVKAGKHAGVNGFFTNGVCFEMDIVDKLIENKRFDLMKHIALELKDNAMKRTLDADFLRKPLKKINYDLEKYVPKSLDELSLDDPEEYRSIYFAWYYNRKGIIIGRVIGNTLPAECIPNCYIDAISRAREVALLS